MCSGSLFGLTNLQCYCVRVSCIRLRGDIEGSKRSICAKRNVILNAEIVDRELRWRNDNSIPKKIQSKYLKRKSLMPVGEATIDDQLWCDCNWLNHILELLGLYRFILFFFTMDLARWNSFVYFFLAKNIKKTVHERQRFNKSYLYADVYMFRECCVLF